MLFEPVNKFLVWRMNQRLIQLDDMMAHALDLQEKLLRNLLKTARHTKWGKQHNYAGIRNPEQFAQQVPVSNYEEIQPLIERVRQGEPNVLWPTEIKWFAKSSGTASGKSKFIPVSHEAIEYCHFRGGKDVLALYTRHKPKTNLFSGYALRLGGSTAVNSHNHETYFGDLSAVLIENFPFWVEMRSTPNQRVALMSEWESKIESIARQAILQNVTSLWGVNSWFLVLMHKVLEMSGRSNILEVWPNLELFAHGGVSFAPYEEQFRAIIPGNQVTFLENYNASEGFFAIQDEVPHNGMLLLTNHGIYYEFIPMHNFKGLESKPIPLCEVQTGVNYAVVISTNAGLWRYILGDTVTFTSTQPHRILITGRTKNFINAFGEELIIDNAEKAIRMACQSTGASVREYMAAPIFMAGNTSGAHEWMIEFSCLPQNLEQFTAALDQSLMQLNSDYEAKRHKNMALRSPMLHIAREGLFFEWLKQKGKLGGQHKVPRLMNDRSIMIELLELNNNNQRN